MDVVGEDEVVRRAEGEDVVPDRDDVPANAPRQHELPHLVLEPHPVAALRDLARLLHVLLERHEPPEQGRALHAVVQDPRDDHVAQLEEDSEVLLVGTSRLHELLERQESLANHSDYGHVLDQAGRLRRDRHGHVLQQHGRSGHELPEVREEADLVRLASTTLLAAARGSGMCSRGPHLHTRVLSPSSRPSARR